MHAITIAEGHLFVLDLNRDGHQDRVAGNTHKVSAIVECNLIANDSRADNFLKVLELNRWRLLYLRKLLEPAEFIFAFKPAATHGPRRGRTVGTVKALGLVGHAHLFHHAQPGSRDFCQGVFFARIHGHVIFAGAARVHEFDDDVVPDSVQVAVAPLFKCVGRGLAASFRSGTLIIAAGRVGFDLIGLSPDDVDPSAIGAPSGNTRSEPLVGVRDAAIVLFLELVLDRVRSGVAALPERLDELLALLVRLQLQESGALFIADDVGDFFLQPLLVGGIELFLELLQVFRFVRRLIAFPFSGILLLVGRSVLCFFVLGIQPVRQEQGSAKQKEQRDTAKAVHMHTSPLIRKLDSIPLRMHASINE